MTLYPKLIIDALEKVIYPGTKTNIIASGMLADTPSIAGNKVKFTPVSYTHLTLPTNREV